MKSKHVYNIIIKNYPINDPINYEPPTLEQLKKQYVGLAEVNQNAQIKENGIFLILRSASLDNIHKGMKYGLWTSTPKSNQKIDNLFKSNDNVYLLYTVVGSKSFQAVAKLQSGFRTESFKYWDEPLKWFGSFEIKCVFLYFSFFQNQLYLGELKQKTLDEKQPAHLGQIVLTDQTDCTEINSNLGQFVIQCFKDLLAEPDHQNPFVKQFPNMDSREQAIKDSRTEDFEQQFEQQQKIFEKSPFEYKNQYRKQQQIRQMQKYADQMMYMNAYNNQYYQQQYFYPPNYQQQYQYPYQPQPFYQQQRQYRKRDNRDRQQD